MLARPEARSYDQYSFAGSITLVSQVASASALDSLNCAVSGASSGRGEGRTIKDAVLARERVEQVDDCGRRVKASAWY